MTSSRRLGVARRSTRDLTGTWALITAYWRSERWREAWLLTMALLALTTLLSMASVWAATASADFLSALARFHAPPLSVDPGDVLFAAALVFAATHIGRAVGQGVRHLVSATLHRRARAWLAGRFDGAILGDERVAFDLLSDRTNLDAGGGRLPDAIDQRVDECTNGLYAGVIGLAMGLWGSVASIYFVTVALLERSAPVPALDRWAGAFADWTARAVGVPVDLSPGDYGTAVVAGATILVYVPLAAWVAWRIGRILKRQTEERQRRDGAWRAELGAMLSRSGHIAASRGQRAQARVNGALYERLDAAWGRRNVTEAGYLGFTNAYAFLSTRLVAWMPALPAYMAGGISFRDFAASSELTAELINDASWFIHVMPAIATLRADAGRLTALAEAIETVRRREAFYAETGVAKLRVERRGPALEISNLRLMQRGVAAPFLRVPTLTVRPGEWAVIRGRNGCGKSSLLKAVAGLWPYGEGRVVLPAGRMLFAAQEPDLPGRLTLKELAAYPRAATAFDDATVAAALGRAGLAHFVGALGDALLNGRPWSEVFSGGQRQKLVLARILLHRPALLLLDEATSAMDVAGGIDFHRAVREAIPDAVVLSVLHDAKPPTDHDGAPFYPAVVVVQNGVARRLQSAAAPATILAAE